MNSPLDPIARSVKIDGYSTSVRLERIFWTVLDGEARQRGMTPGALLDDLHAEFRKAKQTRNFASYLRVLCLFWTLGGEFCRACGCTENNACLDRNGAACSWVEPDLCSVCAAANSPLRARGEPAPSDRRAPRGAGGGVAAE